MPMLKGVAISPLPPPSSPKANHFLMSVLYRPLCPIFMYRVCVHVKLVWIHERCCVFLRDAAFYSYKGDGNPMVWRHDIPNWHTNVWRSMVIGPLFGIDYTKAYCLSFPVECQAAFKVNIGKSGWTFSRIPCLEAFDMHSRCVHGWFT